MKTLKTYLMESRKLYQFKIYFNGKPSAEFAKTIKHYLAPYEVTKVGDLTSKPIAHFHEMFPNDANPDVWTCDVETEYPVTSEQIRTLLSQHVLDKNKLAVVNTQYDQDRAHDHAKTTSNTDKKPLLLSDYEQEKVPVADLTGDDYNEKFVKNSLTHSGVPKDLIKQPKAQTTNDLPQGANSAMGSRKPKLPALPKTGRK